MVDSLHSNELLTSTALASGRDIYKSTDWRPSGTKITRIEIFGAEIPDPSMRELMLICTIFDAQEGLLLRTTITVDDELYQRALDLADPGMDKADLFREAMKVFVRVQAAKRLSALGGQAPKMRMIPRRRPA